MRAFIWVGVTLKFLECENRFRATLNHLEKQSIGHQFFCGFNAEVQTFKICKNVRCKVGTGKGQSKYQVHLYWEELASKGRHVFLGLWERKRSCLTKAQERRLAVRLVFKSS